MLVASTAAVQSVAEAATLSLAPAARMAQSPQPPPPPAEHGPAPSAVAQHSVTLRFRVPFPTRWGENLVLCGDDDRLGAWEPARGSWMQCFHVGDVLVWQVCEPRLSAAGKGRRGRGTEELRPPPPSHSPHTYVPTPTGAGHRPRLLLLPLQIRGGGRTRACPRAPWPTVRQRGVLTAPGRGSRHYPAPPTRLSSAAASVRWCCACSKQTSGLTRRRVALLSPDNLAISWMSSAWSPARGPSTCLPTWLTTRW